MKDKSKPKEQLIKELEAAKKRISELEQSPAEMRLKEERVRLTTIIQSTTDLVAKALPDGQLVYMNASGRRMLGWDENEDITTHKLFDAHTDEASKFVRDEGIKTALTSGTWTGETTIRTRDGREVPVSQVIMAHRSSSGDLEFLSTIMRDISEQKKAEEELKSQRDLSQRYLDIAGVIIVVLDRHGNIVLINKKGCEVLGYEEDELIHRNWIEKYIPPEARKEMKKAFGQLINGELAPFKYYENPVITKDGEIRIIAFNNTILRDSSGNITGTLSSGEDITERKRVEEELSKYRQNLEELVRDRTLELEEKNKKLQEEIVQRTQAEEDKRKVEAQLAQAQRIEALDRFVGGIAHDLNNILYPIIINIEEILDEERQGSYRHEILDQTLKAAYRQRDLVKKILSFSRRNERANQPVRVGPLLEETLSFLRSSLPSTISIQEDIHVQTDVVMGDPIQIQQVIMNLCKNAADAMETGKGVIEIGLTNVRMEPLYYLPDMKMGDYLKLTVKDTGVGMNPEVVNRVFEPFFTRKDIGKGTGLGLPVVHGIVKSHGGAVTVESEEGKGSVFTVYLPISHEEPREEDANVESTPSVQGKESILLVDDEELILSSLQRILKSSGYRVKALKNGQEALKEFSENPDEFDLVITDLTMPGMTGLELARKIQSVRSDIPIVLCTGFNDVISQVEANSFGIKKLLLKPVGAGELKKVIQQALEQ